MKKIIIFTALLCVSSIYAQSKSLHGKLIDNNGSPLANTFLRLVNQDQSTTTDDQGLFNFDGVGSGNYQIDVEISTQDHFITDISYDGTPVEIFVDEISLDKLVVTSNPLEHNTLQMTTPVTLIDEQDLITNRGLNINQTLERIPGVNSASFGNAAGQPVIRGQQGNRVTILNNNGLIQDAANVSPDHWISTEPLLAKRIEVLKGPATLLYGGQAVGGVVNVIDNTIPREMPDGISGGIEMRLSDNTVDARSGVAALDMALTGNLAAHIDYQKTETNSYEIPGYAESAYLRALEEHEEHEHDEEHEEHEEHEEEAYGILENSDIRSQAGSLGISYIGNNGYWGVSYQKFDRNYGIPGHSHAHEHEEHEEHEDDEEHEEHEEHEEEIVRLDLDKTVWAIRGQQRFTESFFKELNFNYSNTNYTHTELEGDEIGTVFDNQASEARVELLHKRLLGFSGALGLQLTNREFSALGEEAYILPSKTNSIGFFMIEEMDFDRWHWEFGWRYDYQQIDGANIAERDEETFSASIGANIKLTDHWSLPLNFSNAQRLATAEELFSNYLTGDELIPHLATAAIEIGNPNLDKETANNMDIGIRYQDDNWNLKAAYFYNKINDFIFLNPTGEESDELPIFVYDQRNATFEGYEIEASYGFSDGFNNSWKIGLFTDAVNAKLNSGGYVPRIPSSRYGLSVDFARGNVGARIDYAHVSRQKDLAEFELPTNSYDMLDMHIEYLLFGGRTETTLFIRGNNLLNEEIRDHASFIKDIAPRPARNLSAGFRVNF